MKVPFVNFGAQYRAHKEEYDEAINRCLEGGKLVLQEDLERFEANLAKRLDMKYAVGVANGTDALILALKAKGIENRYVSTPGYTFKATQEAVVHTGNALSIVDIDEHRLAPYVQIPVHIEGMVCQSPSAIIEDGAQAIGADGVGYSGTFTLSFYPAKILGCFGDGGAVLTDDKDVADKVKLLRHHWQTDQEEQYAHNSRLDNVQAAFLDVRLKYLDEILARRAEIAEKYKELQGIVELPYYQEGRVWQDYVIEAADPLGLVEFLKQNGIETLGYNMVPPHIAQNLGIELPNTERLYARMLRLPLNETLTDEQIDYVISKVKEFYE